MHSWARARHDASTYKYIHSSWFLAANSGHSRNSLIAVNDICKTSTSYRSKPNTVEHRWHVCFDSTYLLCFNSGLSFKSLEFAHVHYPCTASHHCINNFSPVHPATESSAFHYDNAVTQLGCNWLPQHGVGGWGRWGSYQHWNIIIIYLQDICTFSIKSGHWTHHHSVDPMNQVPVHSRVREHLRGFTRVLTKMILYSSPDWGLQARRPAGTSCKKYHKSDWMRHQSKNRVVSPQWSVPAPTSTSSTVHPAWVLP